MNPIAKRQVENAVKVLGMLATMPIVQQELEEGRKIFNLTNFIYSLPTGENEEVLLLVEINEVIVSAIVDPNGEESHGAVEKFRELGYPVTVIERDEIGPVSVRIKIPKEDWYLQLTC